MWTDPSPTEPPRSPVLGHLFQRVLPSLAPEPWPWGQGGTVGNDVGSGSPPAPAEPRHKSEAIDAGAESVGARQTGREASQRGRLAGRSPAPGIEWAAGGGTAEHPSDVPRSRCPRAGLRSSRGFQTTLPRALASSARTGGKLRQAPRGQTSGASPLWQAQLSDSGPPPSYSARPCLHVAGGQEGGE